MGRRTILIGIFMDLIKFCKKCDIALTPIIRSGKRLLCKPCRVKQVSIYNSNNKEKRRIRTNERMRTSGRVKQYPCGICSKPCYKKYALAFCSDKCRFFHYVEITATCWLWKGAINRDGYGKLCFKGNNTAPAHRVSYELFKTDIPQDMHVCHTCDITSCVNPAHLWIGTTQDNKMDQLIKDRGGIKLKAKDVLEIRELHSKGKGSQSLANLYGVTCGTISSIIKRRVWNHI